MTTPSRSKRPYLIRAMHEWMTDIGHTPHVVVDALADGVDVPQEHIRDGKIILNVAEAAAHNLKLANSGISFRARFSGVPYDVWVPSNAVMGIYARETGQGMIFSHDTDADGASAHSAPGTHYGQATRKRTHLTVIK